VPKVCLRSGDAALAERGVESSVAVESRQLDKAAVAIGNTCRGDDFTARFEDHRKKAEGVEDGGEALGAEAGVDGSIGVKPRKDGGKVTVHHSAAGDQNLAVALNGHRARRAPCSWGNKDAAGGEGWVERSGLSGRVAGEDQDG